MSLYGSQSFIKEQYIRILFETCSEEWYKGEDGCMNLTETNEWIKNKHLVALQNQQIFTQNYDDPIKNVARVSRF